MKTKRILILSALFAVATASCKKNDSKIVNENVAPKAREVKWTDFMSDGLDTGWEQDVAYGGSWWLQTATGINWAIVHNTTPASEKKKGRAEVSRRLTYYNGVDKTVIVKGKFKLETTA
ncbi:MAG TPA: hypothetical protein VFM79_13770, partial [Pelobium sp.]|nr:hypothetical protein [Pelobium sp.]